MKTPLTDDQFRMAKSALRCSLMSSASDALSTEQMKNLLNAEDGEFYAILEILDGDSDPDWWRPSPNPSEAMIAFARGMQIIFERATR